MTSNLAQRMASYSERLATEIGAETKVTAFPSGAVMLDVRRNGRGFVMAYSTTHGFGVDEILPDDGFVTGYRFASPDFDSAAEELKQLVGSAEDRAESKPAMNLVVIDTRDIELAKRFYDSLGLSFTSEKHGSGPQHYSASIGSLVFEIYPCRDGETAGPLRIGFRVPSVDGTVATLRSRGVKIVADPKDSVWGRRAVVEDPDGNRVELAQ